MEEPDKEANPLRHSSWDEDLPAAAPVAKTSSFRQRKSAAAVTVVDTDDGSTSRPRWTDGEALVARSSTTDDDEDGTLLSGGIQVSRVLSNDSDPGNSDRRKSMQLWEELRDYVSQGGMQLASSMSSNHASPPTSTKRVKRKKSLGDSLLMKLGSSKATSGANNSANSLGVIQQAMLGSPSPQVTNLSATSNPVHQVMSMDEERKKSAQMLTSSDQQHPPGSPTGGGSGALYPTAAVASAVAAPDENHVDEVALQSLRKVFSVCDKNSDGVLTVKETLSAMKCFGVDVGQEELELLFKELDVVDPNGAEAMGRQHSSKHRLSRVQVEDSSSSGEESELESGDYTTDPSHSTSQQKPFDDSQHDQDHSAVKATSSPPRPSDDAFGAVVAMEEDGDLEKQKRKKKRRGTKHVREQLAIDFEQFTQLVSIWQGAARFRLFETRATETQRHINDELATTHFVTDSIGMWCWQTLVLVCSVYCVCVAIATHMQGETTIGPFFATTTATDFFAMVIFAVDIAVQLRTILVDVREESVVIVDDADEITRRYASTWLLIDLISLIPFRFFIFFGGDAAYSLAYNQTTGALVDVARSGCLACATIDDYRWAMRTAKILSHLRIVKYAAHIKYYTESKIVPLSKVYITMFYNIAQALIDLSRLGILMHTCAVIYCSFDNHIFDRKGTAGLGSVTDDSVSYVRGLYLVMYCLATVGFGDVPPSDDQQRIFFIFLIVTGTLLNAYFIGAFVTFFQRSDIETNRRTTLLEVDSLMDYFRIPEGLKDEVLSFESYLLSTDLLRTHAATVGELPADLQHSLELSTRLRVIGSLPYFEDVHRSAKLQLCNLLEKVTYCPEEYVMYCGEVGEEMFFLNHGFVDILSSTLTYIATLKAGSYFGEMAVMSAAPVPRSANVKSISYCEFYVLDKEGFLDVVNKYPRLRSAIEDTVRNRLQQLKQSTLPKPAPTATSGGKNEGGPDSPFTNESQNESDKRDHDKPIAVAVGSAAMCGTSTSNGSGGPGNSSNKGLVAVVAGAQHDASDNLMVVTLCDNFGDNVEEFSKPRPSISHDDHQMNTSAEMLPSRPLSAQPRIPQVATEDRHHVSTYHSDEEGGGSEGDTFSSGEIFTSRNPFAPDDRVSTSTGKLQGITTTTNSTVQFGRESSSGDKVVERNQKPVTVDHHHHSRTSPKTADLPPSSSTSPHVHDLEASNGSFRSTRGAEVVSSLQMSTSFARKRRQSGGGPRNEGGMSIVAKLLGFAPEGGAPSSSGQQVARTSTASGSPHNNNNNNNNNAGTAAEVTAPITRWEVPSNHVHHVPNRTDEVLNVLGRIRRSVGGDADGLEQSRHPPGGGGGGGGGMSELLGFSHIPEKTHFLPDPTAIASSTLLSKPILAEVMKLTYQEIAEIFEALLDEAQATEEMLEELSSALPHGD